MIQGVAAKWSFSSLSAKATLEIREKGRDSMSYDPFYIPLCTPHQRILHEG